MGHLEHQGYIGLVEFDAEADLLHGEVINTRDVITFQGATPAEVKQAFVESVEDYLAFCKERGESPEKPYTGKLMLRLNSDLHRRLAITAKQQHKSLNQLIADTLQQAVEHPQAS